MITTITLSPAFDRTYYVDNFNVSGLNRAWQVKVNMGGKGINFSSIIAACSLSCTATGFLGEGREKFESFLKEKSVVPDFVETEGEIRTNIKICDISNNSYTDLNQCSSAVSEKDIKKLFKKVDTFCKKNKFLYMGGTLPPGVPTEIYKELIAIGKARGAVCVLDASGEALLKGIEAEPDIIKPNRHEAEEILGRKIETVEDAAKAARKLCSLGAKTTLLTLGGDGAICAEGESVLYARPLPVMARSTVGAGDSFLGGFVYGRSKNLGNAASLKYAVSFSGAKVQTEGTDIPSFGELCALKSEVICNEI